MASAWGTAWGSAWGNSWGDTGAPAPGPVFFRRFGADPRDIWEKRKRQDEEDRRKSLERAWAKAHGLPDPYAEPETEQAVEQEEIPPADLSAIEEALAGANAELDRRRIEAFIKAQEAAMADEAMAILLLTA